MSWQKMPQFSDQSYTSAHFNSYVVNMMFPRKIIVNYHTQISYKFFTFQSHILILIIVEYHYFRVIGKFSLSRSKNDKICFFQYSRLVYLPLTNRTTCRVLDLQSTQGRRRGGEESFGGFPEFFPSPRWKLWARRESRCSNLNSTQTQIY